MICLLSLPAFCFAYRLLIGQMSPPQWPAKQLTKNNAIAYYYYYNGLDNYLFEFSSAITYIFSFDVIVRLQRKDIKRKARNTGPFCGSDTGPLRGEGSVFLPDNRPLRKGNTQWMMLCTVCSDTCCPRVIESRKIR